MTDWYTKTLLTVIAACLLFLAGREAVAPSRNFELSQIVRGLDDIDGSLSLIQGGVQKVAICDAWSNSNNNCVILRSKTSPTGPVLPVLPVAA